MNDADPVAADAAAPLAASDRIVALDVLRGFALLGVFIMNMPGFSHSLFALPGPPRTPLDGWVTSLRETLFAGKFNLLFGAAFGIGFALQMQRLAAGEAARALRLGTAARRRLPVQLVARRLSFLSAIGLVHAMLLWSGDVLLIYAVLGFALLASRGLSDRALCAVLAACLVFPALSEVARTSVLPDSFETVATFQYQQLEGADDLAYGHGSFLEAMRQTARVFDWSWRSPFGRFVYAAFFVQMATGIVAGFLLGRRGWPARPLGGAAGERRAPWAALLTAIVFAAIEPLAAIGLGGSAGIFIAALARTISRAALSAWYALALVRAVRARPRLPPLLRAFRDAGRMPLTNYLMQTALASFIFYGWGLGFWNSSGPTVDAALAIVLFFAVQLPFSRVWMARFRQGPLETLWRRFTYGPPPP